MSEPHRITIDNLPLTEDRRLRVELVPLPSGNDPWRTREDYLREQRRDSVRFLITIATLVLSMIGVAATATVAIVEVRRVSEMSRTYSQDPQPIPATPQTPTFRE